jgi:hypothetical protein
VDKVLDRYYIYPSINKYLGTRVLVNKSGNLCPLIKPMTVEKYVQGGNSTGGSHNDATIAHLTFKNFNSMDIIHVVSIHTGK